MQGGAGRDGICGFTANVSFLLEVSRSCDVVLCCVVLVGLTGSLVFPVRDLILSSFNML